MDFNINVLAGLVAGVAAMVPGAVIYAPGVLGRRWMKEIGINEKKVKEAGGSPTKAVSQMFVVSLINGLVASLIVTTIHATKIMEAVDVALLLGWFWVSANLMLVFFEGRSWMWLKITALAHVLTALVIGLVLGLFLVN